MDEVGRGALAGPVSVGVVLIDETCRTRPAGRQGLQAADRRAPVSGWCRASSAGPSPTPSGTPSADEIDEIGIIAALRLAGCRALAAVAAAGSAPTWSSSTATTTGSPRPSDVGLFAFAARGAGSTTPPVTTMIKADLKCSSVAAASVLAKVTRDRHDGRLGAEQPRRLRLGREQGVRRARAHGRAAPARPVRAAPALVAAARRGRYGAVAVGRRPRRSRSPRARGRSPSTS